METKTLVIGGAVIGIVVLMILWQARKDVIATVGAVGTAVNPLNPNNVFAGSVNKIGDAVTGTTNFSLGSWIYDVTHPIAMTPDQTVYHMT